MRRRTFLGTGGVALAGLFLPGAAGAATMPEIRLIHDRETGLVGFDPVGLFIEVGTTVRWLNTSGVHTVTAYHPANGHHALRIPRAARPWDSGYLVKPGATFTHRLTVAGVYDYFCIPHEIAGMAGRLVVGTASGPGALPYDWFAGEPEARGWQPVPAAVRDRLPPPAMIVEQGRVPLRQALPA